MFSSFIMTFEDQQTREKLNQQLKEYLKLAKQPNLSAGAKTVLQLQIDRTQQLIQQDLK